VNDDTQNVAQYQRQAKLLAVAMDLLRRQVHDSVAFQFANRDRGKESAPDWASQIVTAAAQVKQHRTRDDSAIPLESPSGIVTPKPPVQRTYGFGMTVESPPIPLADAKPAPAGSPEKPYGFKPGDEPPAIKMTPGAFGLGGAKPEENKVSAFDRPMNVIITGPNPLPVSFKNAGAFKQPPPVHSPEASGGGANVGLNFMKAVAGKFLAILAPLYALSTILGQTNSGFGVFQKSVQVFGASLAPVFLPPFALLAAGILTLSDYISAKLLPALKGYYAWATKVPTALTGGRPYEAQEDKRLLAGLEDKFKEINARRQKEGKPELSDEERSLARNRLAVMMRRQREPKFADLFTSVESEAKKLPFNPKPLLSAKEIKAATPKNESLTKFDANMQAVLKSLAMSMGPKASYSGVAEAAKETQLTALNADPIEMKAAQKIIETIQEFMKAFNEYEREKNGEEPNQIHRRDDLRSTSNAGAEAASHLRLMGIG